MKLYFGNAVTTATTLMILALLGFIGWSAFNRTNIQYRKQKMSAVDDAYWCEKGYVTGKPWK